MKAGTSPLSRRRYPLHVYIASLFTVLVLTTGILIAAVDYRNARNLALNAVHDIFERSARETLAELRAGHEPIRTLVTLSAQQLHNGHELPAAHLDNLALIRRALDAAPLLSAIYIGYADGGLFSVQRIGFSAARRANHAPAGTTYLVRVSMPDDSFDDALFYDNEMTLLERRPIPRLDARKTPWFQAAIAAQGLTRTPAFAVASGDIGFAVAESTPDRQAVVGGDLTLKELSASLSRQRAAPSAQLALVDASGNALAASHGSWTRPDDEAPALPTLDSLDLPILAKAFASSKRDKGLQTLRHDGRDWETMSVTYEIAGGDPLYLILAAPHDELLASVRQLATQAIISILAVLLFAVPATWLIARRISQSLRHLSQDAEAIRRFNFVEGKQVDSFVLEVDDLGKAMAAMRSTIRQFLDIASRLSAERHFQPLLDGLISQTVKSAQAEAGTVYLIDETGRELRPAAWQNIDLSHLVEPPPAIPVNDADEHPIRQAWHQRQLIAGQFTVPFPPGLGWLSPRFPGQRVSYLAVPLSSREGRAVGVLLLTKSATLSDFTSEQASFVNALSGTLAIAIDNQRLMGAQKALLDAVIRVMAGAIDAKSHYTGGHCQRVPELVLMLAEAACQSEQGHFADFRLSQDEWETLSIAAWLHDIGKLTTPEFVVDKATKLETIYDRIHEIRMRFEVLKRDAELAYWQGIAEGGDASALAARRDTELRQLDDDFAFVARCNVGGETLPEANLRRLQDLANRTWRRTLDDRLGISHIEAARKAQQAPPVLPTDEALIADRDDLRIAHTSDQTLPEDILMQPSRYRLDLGELHCLAVGRGTLTDEERFLINNHIVQTIVMLRGLPFPEHLRDVPDVAGNHHEHLDGSGYPRRLAADAMSTQARIVAIADIFEALTAADRPYKRGKMLSEAVGLLGERVRMGHLDPQLFELFLRAGIHRRFAERFLDPGQIDTVDIEAAIAAATSTQTSPHSTTNSVKN